MDGERVLAEAAEAYRIALGDRLLAAYALGSLAHGGFSALVSDVDLGLILGDPLQPGDGDAIRAIAEMEKSKGSVLHERLSVFWGRLPRSAGTRRAAAFPRSIGWTCSRTAACSSATTMPAEACPRPAHETCSSPARSSPWPPWPGSATRTTRGARMRRRRSSRRTCC